MIKRAVVIGATSGIGLEVTRVLTEQGWQVGIAGRRQERLQEIQRQNLNVVATQQLDVTHADAPDRLLQLIGKMGGTVDLILHSSGIGYQNTALDMERELATVETNALGMTRIVGAAFNYLAERPSHDVHLAVISSIAGTRGLGAAPAYSASKRFVNTYVECLQQLCTIRCLRHIHLHDIRPGFVRTPLLADGHHYPLQLDPRRVAESIVRGILRGRSVITIDWRYRLLTALWRLIPRWLWVRMRVVSR